MDQASSARRSLSSELRVILGARVLSHRIFYTMFLDFISKAMGNL
jgi:hypothetical protein